MMMKREGTSIGFCLKRVMLNLPPSKWKTLHLIRWC